MDPSSSPDYGPTGDIDIPLKLNIEMNTSPYAVDETIRGFHPVLTPDAGALGPSNNDGGDGASPTSAVDDISDSASSKRSNNSVPSSDVASINLPATTIVKRRRKRRRKKFVNVTREVEYNSAVIGGCLLSVNAGYLNAVTILETGLSCANMSGSTLRIGITLETGDFAETGKYLVLITAFTFGSALTGMLGGNYDNFHLGHSYGRVLSLCFAVLLLALLAERYSRFPIVYVTLCCVACGLQNAMTTKFSGNMIRTSHVTGSLTDIGIALGRMWRGRNDQAWKLALLCPLVLCYMGGGALGSFAHQHLERQSVLVNVILFGFTASIYSVYFSKYFKVKFWEALFGIYDFAEEEERKVGVGDDPDDKSSSFYPPTDELNAVELEEEEEHMSTTTRITVPLISSSATVATSATTSPLTSRNFTTTKEVEYTAAVIGGCLLSVNAGYINAITLLETGQAVSHMTGHVTRLATTIDHREWDALSTHAAILGAFTFGSMLTGLLGGNYDTFKLGHSYGRIFTAGFIILLIAFAADVALDNKLIHVAFLAMACGLQNAMTTKFSGSMIRTTHVTGSLTDIGLTIGRALRGRREQVWKLGILIPMTISFFIGSLLGSVCLNVLQHSSVIVNIVLFGTTALLYSIYFSKYFKVKFWEAVFDTIEFATPAERERVDGVTPQDREDVVVYKPQPRNPAGADLRRESSSTDAFY